MKSRVSCSSPPASRLADYVYFAGTKSLCGVCKAPVDAKIIFRDSGVFMRKFCPKHGHQECLLASSVQWYLESLSFLAPRKGPRAVRKSADLGCPFDCGFCTSHMQTVYLPVIPITSACNRNCPRCFTINKNESPYMMSSDDMQQVLDRIEENHDDLDIINLTGGEPTLHPELPHLLEICRNRGIRRLTVSTNGLRLADEDYVKRLAEVGARIILSMDTLKGENELALVGSDTVGAKMRALDLLEKHAVSVSILPTVALGINDAEIGQLFDLVIERPNVPALTVHSIAFTGRGGTGFDRAARITVPDLHRRLEQGTAGRIRSDDFVPSPLAHPHCYSICYLLCLDGGGYVPFTRLMSREKLFGLLQDSLYIEPRAKFEDVLREMIDDLWANPDRLPESRSVLKTLKRLLNEMFPPEGERPSETERQRIAERSAKAIYIHSHMDEESFDVSRAMSCCVCVPELDGTIIPACSYNVYHRERDTRFTDNGLPEKMKADREKYVSVCTEWST